GGGGGGGGRGRGGWEARHTSSAIYENSSRPTRLPIPSTFSHCAVRIATHMVTISGTTAKRVARPSSSSPPHTNSAVEANRAWKAGFGMPSSVHYPVTFSRSSSLPHPPSTKTHPTHTHP